MVLRLVACLSLALVAVTSLPITKERLKFKLSAKGLPDKDNIGTIDPYVEIFYTQAGSLKETKLGVTDAIQDNENPGWDNVLEFDFDRSKNQKWHFLIWDKDHGRADDKGGQTWVDVNDYVDKGQFINSNLVKQGYLTVKSADPQIQQRTLHTPGSLPTAPGSPATGQLKFRISASGIKDKDKLGKTDPYAEIYTANGLTAQPVKVGRTATVKNTKDPQWGDIFTVNWDRSKDQRLLVKIFDNDNFREDDKTGLAWLEINDYVAKGQVMTVNLNNQGTLTVSRADGLPPNPYNPNAPPPQLPAPNRQQVPLSPNSPQNQPPYSPQSPGNNRQQFPNSPTQHSQQFPSSPQQFPSGNHGRPTGNNQQYPTGNNQQHPTGNNQQYPTGNNQQFPAPTGNQQHQPGFNHPGVPQQFPNTQPQRQTVIHPAPPPKYQQPISPPAPPKPQYPIKMKFKLSASNLEDKDLYGTSDPYAKVYIAQDGTPETLLKTSSKLKDDENPKWNDIFEFDYNPAKHQKLRFLILDEDDNARDDELGNVSLDASDLEIRSYVVLRLPTGSLTVTKV